MRLLCLAALAALSSGVSFNVQNGLVTPTLRIASSADLEAARSSAETAIVHFHSLRCRRCRLTRARLARLAREWTHETSPARFLEVLVEDDATQRLASQYGIKHLPAVVVLGAGSGAATTEEAAEACVVSCAPRGTGHALAVSELRDAINACIACQQSEDGCAVPELDEQTAAAADLIFTALPVSLVYVLIERLGAIQADLSEVAEAVGGIDPGAFGI